MAQQTSTKRFIALDAFRGIAAIMIILFHSQFYVDSEPNAFIRHSYIFVDFFFVLSGFVIGYSYHDKILQGISFKKFLLFRFARLYPLHLFMLLVWIPYIGVKIYLYNKGVGVTDPIVENNITSFIQNLFLLQGIGASTSWNYPSWSIGVEFYTYLFFFLILFLSKKFEYVVRLSFIFFIAVLAYFLASSYEIETCIWANLFRGIGEFFFGVIVYYGYKNIDIKINSSLIATLLELGILVILIYLMNNINLDNYEYYIIILFMITVYLFSIQNIGYVSKILSTAPMQHLGKISYSIYMTHAIIVTGMYNVLIYLFHLQTGAVVGVPSGIIFKYAFYLDIFFIVIIIGISTLTYKYIELPGQEYLKKRFEKDEK